MKATRTATAWLLLLSLIWGSTWISNGMMAEPDAPLHTSLLRYAFSWIFLALALVAQFVVRRTRTPAPAHTNQLSSPLDSPKPSPPANQAVPGFGILWALDLPAKNDRAWVGPSIVLGLTMFGLPDLLLVAAARHGAAPWTPMIYAGLPLALLLAAGEFSSAAILGFGAMLVLLNGSLPLTAGKLGWALLIVAAVALQGWSLLYARRHLAVAASLRGCMVQLMAAFWTLFVAIQFWPESGTIPLRYWPASSAAALVALAGIATAFAYPVYYRLLIELKPGLLATTAWLQTLVAVAESAILLRQRPGLPMIFAALVLVGCTVLLLRQPEAAGTTLRASH